MIGAFEHDQLSVRAQRGHAVGFFDRHHRVGVAVHQQPGHLHLIREALDRADGLHVVEKVLRQRALRLVPHEAFARHNIAELAVREVVGVDHAAERDQHLDATVNKGALHADHRSHRVTGVGDGPVAIARGNGIEHRSEVADLLGRAGFTKVTFRITIAREAEAQTREAGCVQRVRQRGRPLTVLVGGHAVTDDHDLIAAALAFGEGVVERLPLRVADLAEHRAS